ncbi:hypothetical protein [Photorhabdus laumondii]|uniref:hypothetical protein n=1 Tax=Photorhabdus laumondii TaxID=2218628 RepID=UPI0025B0B334|nr:hypothetical protein [Photorhabdus laumondii]
MIKVTINIFSGRENPCWLIKDPLASSFLKEIINNKKHLNHELTPSVIGNNEIIVEILDPEIVQNFDLPVIFRIVDDISYGHNLTKILLNSATEFNMGKNIIKNPTQSSRRSHHRSESNQDATKMATDSEGQQADIISSSHQLPGFENCYLQFGRFNAPFWNSSNDIVCANNCYAYACNIRMPAGNSFPYPGFCNTNSIPTTSEQLLNGVKSDGLIKVEDLKKCPELKELKPVWLIAMVSGHPTEWGWDFHFYRKVWSGREEDKYYWSHKLGSGLVTKLKADISPKIDAKDRRYNEWHGYFLVPSTNTICNR